ncbi:helix-turn-helix transcriptional regulator [Pantoea allii]|jgi:ArsR family transcriptional regulator|uniref:DNA-binding transcriptional ArsR family regulator n=1 Tax=Pantoea allii TaxID=574096 RepID=A0A2V2BLI2_9GAMM|nr:MULTISPECIES: helix-turn-helix transcriptional regulator [Pantoea]MBW1251702.1 ArsR family transcriptional regulator [Pantoea allii]MBW1260299.1 ArsR family transcriptional regulator [Pantoea allii]MBW1282896.1 ArsR family transcriptional regulator [Pantoea allii]MDJ0036807.1 helix-turn-helix transcriptional regulator [Pantoea allii]MDJ0042801.1 helix-turn-helix transcriptional regulator [Pantoea allii]
MTPENAIKLLANPTRVAVLKWLKNPDEAFADYAQLYPFDQYGVCASLIQDKAGLSQPATSLCLKALHDAGLLEASKVGKWTYYRRREQAVYEMNEAIIKSLQQL